MYHVLVLVVHHTEVKVNMTHRCSVDALNVPDNIPLYFPQDFFVSDSHMYIMYVVTEGLESWSRWKLTENR